MSISGVVLMSGTSVVLAAGLRRRDDSAERAAEEQAERRDMESFRQGCVCHATDNNYDFGSLVRTLANIVGDIVAKMKPMAKGQEINPKEIASKIMDKLMAQMSGLLLRIKFKNNAGYVKFTDKEINKLMSSFQDLLRGNVPACAAPNDKDSISRDIREVGTYLESDSVQAFVAEVGVELKTQMAAYHPQFKPKE